jgi:hypothetical protein
MPALRSRKATSLAQLHRFLVQRTLDTSASPQSDNGTYQQFVGAWQLADARGENYIERRSTREVCPKG